MYNDNSMLLFVCAVSEGFVIEKLNNKQKVYVYNQSLFPKVDKSQIQELDQKINEYKISLQEGEQKMKEVSSEIASLSSVPPLEKVKIQYEELCEKEVTLREKLSEIEEGAALIEPDVKKAILDDYEKYSKVNKIPLFSAGLHCLKQRTKQS